MSSRTPTVLSSSQRQQGRKKKKHFFVGINESFLQYLHAGQTECSWIWRWDNSTYQKALCSKYWVQRKQPGATDQNTDTCTACRIWPSVSVLAAWCLNFLICKNITAALSHGAVVRIHREKPFEALKVLHSWCDYKFLIKKYILEPVLCT